MSSNNATVKAWQNCPQRTKNFVGVKKSILEPEMFKYVYAFSPWPLEIFTDYFLYYITLLLLL